MFSVRDFQKEIVELRLPKKKLAQAIGVSAPYISELLDGSRRPSQEIERRISFVFHFIREVQMASGGFAIDRAGINRLRKGIRDMEKSVVRSSRTQPKDESVEQEAQCPAN